MGELLDIELPASARERLITVGDAVRLPPSLVQPIALVLHELLTNAVEHGALASSRGSIRLEWRKQDGDLLLHWQEEGLEELAEPGQRGVGLRMLDSLMRKQLHGSVDMRWSPPGLDLRMVLPIAVEDAAPSELDPVA
jgi:two-component sensor histidine kinase